MVPLRIWASQNSLHNLAPLAPDALPEATNKYSGSEIIALG